jgi:hypothetical protein
MSGKKLSASVVMKSPVVAWSAPQKHYHLSSIQDHKRWGYEGLLSQLAVHAARQDGKTVRPRKALEAGGSGGYVVCL